jgi:probable DNA metabolism protein
MALFVYEGSFTGLLTSIFHSFATKCRPTDIVKQARYQASLLDEVVLIEADEDKAERVLRGIDARSNNKGSKLIYKMYLSELPGIELSIYQLVCLLVAKNNPGILDNYANEVVRYSHQVVKMIHREVHRMHALVRFSQLPDGYYQALIQPDFDVLPLIGDHFLRRYADQPWMIIDTARRYGLVYDLSKIDYIDTAILIENSASAAASESSHEALYQQLWKQYFHSVNIPERKNPKLHLRHLPKRYWKYLVEKQR